MKKGQEEGGEEEEEEEDSCTLGAWEGRVDWERRQPPWQETPIQYSSPEATVELESQKNKEKAFPTKRLFRENSEENKEKL